MAVTLRWLGKSCEVTPKKIYRPSGFTTAVVGKRNEVTNLPAGKELRTISFDLKVGGAAGMVPRSEIAWWESKVGRADPLIIGGARFGPAEMVLDSAESNVLLDNTGAFYEATITLSFTEKPSLKAVLSALKADAKERAKSESNKKKKKKILNSQLKKAQKAAKKKYKKV